MISKNIENIKKELDSNHAELVVVTKYQNLEDTATAIENGASIIWESKIQNAVVKKEELDKLWLDYKLHIIGHLQSNKAKKAVEIADMIQSVDSYKLASKLDKEAMKIWKYINILLQLNLTKEDQKYGIKEEELEEIIIKVRKLENIKLCWLMCMGKNNDTEETMKIFQKLRKLVDKQCLHICSMWMTWDYKIALECGSNMVRIGSKIFLEK